MSTDNILLEVSNLKVTFKNEDGIVKAVDDVDFSVISGKVTGIVGESGCGKSVTALSIMQLVPSPQGTIEQGKILFNRNGTDKDKIDITSLHPRGRQMRSIRGNNIAMIFQEPMTSLNPVYTVGEQIREVVSLHQDLGTQGTKRRVIEILAEVGLPNPAQVVNEYPHQLSGGMRQRVMIAMACSCNPDLLIADEPTTALDVTTQAKILDLISELQDKYNMSTMMITHDLGVIAEMSDDVVVMYMGQVVEHADARTVFHNPQHPYTRGLLKSIPKLGERIKKDLQPIKGSVPEPYNLPKGCLFSPRCEEKMRKCLKKPSLKEIKQGHEVRCWLYE